jgi:hypothetical protein
MSKLRYSEKNIKKDVPQHLNVNYVVGLIPMRDMEHN